MREADKYVNDKSKPPKGAVKVGDNNVEKRSMSLHDDCFELLLFFMQDTG